MRSARIQLYVLAGALGSEARAVVHATHHAIWRVGEG